jgi:hypothetical protein
MNRSSNIVRYLQRYSVRQDRPLRMASAEGIGMVVVIPALAESASLFRTLAGIAVNPPGELARTMILCVVNNHAPPLTDPEAISNNQGTLLMLEDLLRGSTQFSAPVGKREDLIKINGGALRLGYIDASSPGREIPEGDGGVGTARKIGMDAALALLEVEGDGRGVIVCLDADTLVQENYLAAVNGHFSDSRDVAAVVRYAHQMPADPRLMAAICRYEIFLRAYVIGLSFAGSPYAFHSIGSTMSCTAQAYADVRGMNRRTAAEDFHFLNKLAKIGGVGLIDTTTVFPSARPSARVPFGTGRSILRFMSGQTDEYRLHDPRIFMILREWLEGIRSEPDRDAGKILGAARKIHPRLEEYLRLNRFDAAWRDIRSNCPDAIHLCRQFHVWFDGLKTLRLVHHLSRTEFPPVPMFKGLHGLLDRMGRQIPSLNGICGDSPAIDLQLLILEELRQRFPGS